MQTFKGRRVGWSGNSRLGLIHKIIQEFRLVGHFAIELLSLDPMWLSLSPPFLIPWELERRSTEWTIVHLSRCNFRSYPKSSHMAFLACKGIGKGGVRSQEPLGLPKTQKKRKLDTRGQYSSSFHKSTFLATNLYILFSTWRINAPLLKGTKPESHRVHNPGTLGSGESFKQF